MLHSVLFLWVKSCRSYILYIMQCTNECDFSLRRFNKRYYYIKSLNSAAIGDNTVHALQYVNEEFAAIKIMRHTCKSLLKPTLIISLQM